MKIILLLLCVTLVAVMCRDHEIVLPDQRVSTALSGANENPPVTTNATGSVEGTFNPNTRLLKLSVSFSGIVPTAGHIHKAAVGQNGPVIIPFTGLATSPYMLEVTLTPSQAEELRTDLHYVNLHSTSYPGGEIRGQLKLATL